MENVFIDLGDDLQVANGDSLTIGEDNILSESETIVGPPGPPGPPGKDGKDGQDGQAATITVGNTTTTAPETDAIVTNVGDEQNAVLNFSIPRGAQGLQGEQGETGEAGEDGFSPIVQVTETPTGYSLLITDAEGTTGVNLYNGVDGADGQAATITVGSTTTGSAGTNASVTNSGTSSAAVLDFVIPRGADGAPGADGQDGAPGADGQAATITVGTTTTGSAGTNASVTNTGTSSAAVLDFVIPRGADGAPGADGADGAPGADGQAATITVGTTSTGNPGTSASVTNSGTSSAAVFNFVIPRGADGQNGTNGQDGAPGAAATITVGSTTTGGAGTNASVTNSGTSSAAVLDFVIPKGDTGDTGATGPTGPGAIADYAHYETILNSDQTSGTFSYTATKNGFVLLTMGANNTRAFSTIQVRPSGTTTDINVGSFVISAHSSSGNTQITTCYPLGTGDTLKATNLSSNVFVTSRTIFVPYK